jgi:lysyl endopeptidase
MIGTEVMQWLGMDPGPWDSLVNLGFPGCIRMIRTLARQAGFGGRAGSPAVSRGAAINGFAASALLVFALLFHVYAFSAETETVKALAFERYQGLDVAPAEPVRLRVNGAASTAVARLAPMAQAEHSEFRDGQALEARVRQRIGVPRILPDLEREATNSQSLRWVDAADGGKAAQFSITSPGAKAMRVGIGVVQMPATIELSVVGSEDPGRVYGPVPGAELLRQQPIYWTPVTRGDTATVEFYAPAGVDPASVVFYVPQVSHLIAAPEDAEWSAGTGIGAAGFCQVDVACTNPDQALRNAAASVAMMIFTESGDTFGCTGTLLNDTDPRSFIPYFYSAAHCIDTQTVASTLNTYWFFDAASCGGGTAPALEHLSGGATLLHADTVVDSALVRLNEASPAGAVFSGWDASPVVPGMPATVLHHSRGDLKKISQGRAEDFVRLQGMQGTFIRLSWSSGIVEAGASGSPLFDFDGQSYVLRGSMTAASPWLSCSNPQQGWGFASRFDQAFPSIKRYLAPPAPETTVVEYINVADFPNDPGGHYFYTADPGEQAWVDSGGAGRFMRTGGGFKTGGSIPVCRFYGSMFPGPNSHFFTADADECGFLRSLQKTPIPQDIQQWNYEGEGFLTSPPDVNADGSRTCMAGTVPVYRAYNNAFTPEARKNPWDSNHRFTGDRAAMEALLAQGWRDEGIVFCAPR